MGFVSGIRGTLVGWMDDLGTSAAYHIRFNGSADDLRLLGAGALVTTANTGSGGHDTCASVLEIVSVRPTRRPPQGDTSSTEGDHGESLADVQIDLDCVAIPTGMEIVQAEGEPLPPREESGVPIVGATVQALDAAETLAVINNGIGADDQTVASGMAGSPGFARAQVRIQVRIDEMLRGHFGVVASVGACRLVSKLLCSVLDGCGECSACDAGQDCARRGATKAVVFDPGGQYAASMAEQLVRQPEARWIVVGPESLPEAVVHYLRAAPDTASAEELHAAVAALCESCVLPRESGTPRADLARPFRLLLTRRKLLVWQHVEPLSLGEFVASIRDVVLRGSMGNIGPALYEFHGQLVAEYNGQPLDDDTYASASDDIDAFIGAGEDSSGNKMNGTALKNLEGLRRRLRCKVDEVNACDILPEHARITMPDLVDHLNDPSTMGLFVIQSHDLDALRNFATTLGDAVYRARRRNGMSRPIVSFVFDEADKVMPSFLPGAAGDLIKMVTTLARNGVRLGLGIGIAMRDLASVHDAVVGFPRTWFIGRIARTGGRETIAAAIDVPDVSLLPAHYAREGEWLAVSDEAMGLTGVPIPFCLDAAAERARPLPGPFDKASDR